MTQSSAPAFPMPAPTPVWHLYRALVGIGILCGVLIVGTYEWTRPIIQANKIAMRQSAIFEVLEGAVKSSTYRYDEDKGTFEPVPDDTATGDLAFAGFDDQGKLVGVAMEAEGQGYGDVVRVLYGYDPEQQAVVGIYVLDSRETPGLGDRVQSDPGYQANFERLDVSLAEGGAQLANEVQFVKNGQKRHPWQIDGITGATITSRAVADMISRSTALWIPRVAKDRAVFKPHAAQLEK